MERLILRYCLSPPDSISDEEEIYQIKKKRQVPIRLRVLNVLKYWVEHHYEIDFRDPKVVELIEYFVRNTVTRTGHKSFADYIMNLFERKVRFLFYFILFYYYFVFYFVLFLFLFIFFIYYFYLLLFYLIHR